MSRNWNLSERKDGYHHVLYGLGWCSAYEDISYYDILYCILYFLIKGRVLNNAVQFRFMLYCILHCVSEKRQNEKNMLHYIICPLLKTEKS